MATKDHPDISKAKGSDEESLKKEESDMEEFEQI